MPSLLEFQRAMAAAILGRRPDTDNVSPDRVLAALSVEAASDHFAYFACAADRATSCLS